MDPVTDDQDEYFKFGKGGSGAPMRDSQGNIVSTRKPNAYYEDNLGLKPSVSQEQLTFNINKANQNELLK